MLPLVCRAVPLSLSVVSFSFWLSSSFLCWCGLIGVITALFLTPLGFNLLITRLVRGESGGGMLKIFPFLTSHTVTQVFLPLSFRYVCCVSCSLTPRSSQRFMLLIFSIFLARAVFLPELCNNFVMQIKLAMMFLVVGLFHGG